MNTQTVVDFFAALIADERIIVWGITGLAGLLWKILKDKDKIAWIRTAAWVAFIVAEKSGKGKSGNEKLLLALQILQENLAANNIKMDDKSRKQAEMYFRGFAALPHDEPSQKAEASVDVPLIQPRVLDRKIADDIMAVVNGKSK